MNKYEKKIEELLSQLNNLQQENASLHNLLEKKDTEEKIKDAEERFRMVFENVLDGVSIYEENPDPAKRRLIECNNQLANLAGRSREELLKIGYTLDLQKKLDENANKNRIESLKIGKSYKGTFSWIRPDGKENVIEYIGTPITWRGKSYSIGIDRDITEHIKNEEALRESEEKYRLVFKYSPLGLLSFDENGIIVACNDKFTQIVGSPLEKLIGVNLLNLPDQQLVSALHNALNGKLGLFEDTYSSTLAEKVTPLRGLFTSKYVEGKGIMGGVGIIEDISERKKAEEEILKANAELKRINSIKDKFFSIVAHDLKSPFQGLVGMTGMMADDIDSFSKLELSDFSIKMHRNVKNLTKLLTNLLDWARMQQGTIRYEPSEFDLSELICRNVNLISKCKDQKEIEIILDLTDNQIISADDEMLNSILGNLLSNAVKFTPRGGKISVNTKTIENNMVMITVKDSGIGIPENLKEKMFRIEEKVGRTGTEGEESTGLGLLLCKEFVEKHGGKIWVESRENVGSAFSFTLPKSI